MADLRTKCLSTKVTEEEYERCQAATGDQRVGVWAREVLLRATAAQPIAVIILEELLAVRTIVLNVQYVLARGETLSLEAMHGLIDRADQEKRGRAEARRHAQYL